jgi:hypothetical protein
LRYLGDVGISINDLRRICADLNEYMTGECCSQARYGVLLDVLITIDLPTGSGIGAAAITRHNQVSSDTSLAQSPDQRGAVPRAVEIETLKAQAGSR